MDKKKKIVYCVVIAVLIAAIAITAVLIKSNSVNNDGGNKQTVPESTESVEKMPEEMEYNKKIETPYITFSYPEEWEENVEIIAGEEGDAYIITLNELISSDKIELFSVVFAAESETGTLLGSVNGQNVFAEVGAIEAKENWADDETAKINLIQGYINDFIEQLNECEGFVPA